MSISCGMRVISRAPIPMPAPLRSMLQAISRTNTKPPITIRRSRLRMDGRSTPGVIGESCSRSAVDDALAGMTQAIELPIGVMQVEPDRAGSSRGSAADLGQLELDAAGYIDAYAVLLTGRRTLDRL